MGILIKPANEVIILSIGDEILIGQINNTNASWMGELLNSEGFKTKAILSVGDSEEAILEGLRYGAAQANLVLITGGLGPTKDDITKKVVCNFFDSQLIIHQPTLEHVTSFFAKRGKPLTELNRLQAMVPDQCTVIDNPVGTAPGMYFNKENVHYVFMPGVPFEMKSIMESWVIPQMKKQLPTDAIYQKTILTHGLGESFLAQTIEKWEDNLPENIGLAYLPSPGKVRLRLRAIGQNTELLKSQVDDQIKALQTIIPEAIYGFNDDTMEAEIGKLLKQNHKTVATAESCSGGYISHKITEVPGSSDYFYGTIVSYTNQAKINLLKVEAKTIEQYGAVSEQVAKQMAIGVRNRFGTDYGLATTGIAGPAGGTDEKPVGTVWIALSSEAGCVAKHFQFGDHRLRNINMTALSAMNMLRMELQRSFTWSNE